ncbi:hypothetical protein F4780DRAFT_784724 [Xylariomycetidae sp. FL0641]|nr:hypothetical protein F4780DRAFT_784724 [Xylariomycetidae sp. FL0641]
MALETSDTTEELRFEPLERHELNVEPGQERNATQLKKIAQRGNALLFQNELIRGESSWDRDDWTELQRKECNKLWTAKKENLGPIPANYRRLMPSTHSIFHKTHKSMVRRDLHIRSEHIKSVVKYATERWYKVPDARAQKLKTAIEKTADKFRITKVVCIGMGAILYVDRTGSMNCSIAPLAQHVAAIKIVEVLKRALGQDVKLYAADPVYGPSHKTALESLSGIPFTIVDPSYDKHEHFGLIDSSTLVLCCGVGPQALQLLEETARPMVIITNGPAREVSEERKQRQIENPKFREIMEKPGFPIDPVKHKLGDDAYFKDENGGRHRVADIQWTWMFLDKDEKVQLPVPGCDRMSLDHSTAVCEMLHDEYDISSDFPIEWEDENLGDQCLYDPAKSGIPESEQVELRGKMQVLNNPGLDHCKYWYWSSDVRMYVRKN